MAVSESKTHYYSYSESFISTAGPLPRSLAYFYRNLDQTNQTLTLDWEFHIFCALRSHHKFSVMLGRRW